MSWNIPLSFIFLLIFEQQYQDREGKMLNLQDREMIDSGEMDRKFKEMRESRIKSLHFSSNDVQCIRKDLRQ